MNILKVTKDAIDVLSFSSEVKRSHLEPVEVKGEKTAKEAPMEKSRGIPQDLYKSWTAVYLKI